MLEALEQTRPIWQADVDFEVRPMEELEALVWKWIEPETPRARPKKVTLLMIDELWRVYQYLKHGQRGEFFSSDLVPYLKKCGVKVDGPERYENGQLVFGYAAYL